MKASTNYKICSIYKYLIKNLLPPLYIHLELGQTFSHLKQYLNLSLNEKKNVFLFNNFFLKKKNEITW